MLLQGLIIQNYRQPLLFKIIKNCSYAGGSTYGTKKRHSFVRGFQTLAKRFNLDLSQYAFFNSIPDEAVSLAAAAVRFPISHYHINYQLDSFAAQVSH